MDKKIGIIGAMDVEVNLLKSCLEAPKTTEAGGLVFVEGLLNKIPVIIVKSGVGKVNAALCTQRLILQMGATHIINTGIAGAMAKGLRVLDLWSPPMHSITTWMRLDLATRFRKSRR